MVDDPKYPYPNPDPRSPGYNPRGNPVGPGNPVGRIRQAGVPLAETVPPEVELTVEQRLEKLEAWVKERVFGRTQHQRGNPPRPGNPHVNAEGHAINAEGQRIDHKGQLIDDQGYSLNAEGHRVDSDGRLLDDAGALILESKLEPTVYDPQRNN